MKDKHYLWNRGSMAIIVVGILYAFGYGDGSFRSWLLRLLTFGIMVFLAWASYKLFIAVSPNTAATWWVVNKRRPSPETKD